MLNKLNKKLIEKCVEGYSSFQDQLDNLSPVTRPYSEKEFNDYREKEKVLLKRRDWWMDMYLFHSKDENNLLNELGITTA